MLESFAAKIIFLFRCVCGHFYDQTIAKFKISAWRSQKNENWNNWYITAVGVFHWNWISFCLCICVWVGSIQKWCSMFHYMKCMGTKYFKAQARHPRERFCRFGIRLCFCFSLFCALSFIPHGWKWSEKVLFYGIGRLSLSCRQHRISLGNFTMELAFLCITIE